MAKHRVAPADKLHEVPDQDRVRVAGIVKHRQRPESAKGVTFVTLQDETGVVRAVVWRDLGERHRKILLRSHLLAVTRKVERDGDVTHIIAQGL